MAFIDILKAAIPKDAVFHSVIALDENPDVTVIEYDLAGVLGRMHFTKLNVNTKFTTPIFIPYKEDMTISNVYEHINKKFKLGFSEGIDYKANSDKVIPDKGFETYVIESTSYGYTGYFQVFISTGKNNLVKDGKTRDIRFADIGLNLVETKIRERLSWKVFNSEGKLFSGYMISFLFRDMITEHLKDFDKSDVDDIIFGFIEYTLNDGLSDIIMIRTPSAKLYPIRFNSRLGDIPISR